MLTKIFKAQVSEKLSNIFFYCAIFTSMGIFLWKKLFEGLHHLAKQEGGDKEKIAPKTVFQIDFLANTLHICI